MTGEDAVCGMDVLHVCEDVLYVLYVCEDVLYVLYVCEDILYVLYVCEDILYVLYVCEDVLYVLYCTYVYVYYVRMYCMYCVSVRMYCVSVRMYCLSIRMYCMYVLHVRMSVKMYCMYCIFCVDILCVLCTCTLCILCMCRMYHVMDMRISNTTTFVYAHISCITFCVAHHGCSNPSPGYNLTDTSCSDIDIPVLFIIIILIEACGTLLLQQKILKSKIQHQIIAFFSLLFVLQLLILCLTRTIHATQHCSTV